MFCHKCGAQIAEGIKFCPKCGTKCLENGQSESGEKREGKETYDPQVVRPSWNASTEPLQDELVLEKNGIPKKIRNGKRNGIIYALIGLFAFISSVFTLSSVSAAERAFNRMFSNNGKETTAIILLIVGIVFALYGIFLAGNAIMLKDNYVGVYRNKVVLDYRDSVFSLDAIAHGIKNVKVTKMTIPMDRIDAASVSKSRSSEYLELNSSGTVRKIIIIDGEELANAINQCRGI